jgi:hypothetical protein
MPLTLADLDPDVLAEVYLFIDVPLPLKATCKATCAAAHKAGHAKTLTKWKQLFPDSHKVWDPPIGVATYMNRRERPPMYLWAHAMGGCQEERNRAILDTQQSLYGLKKTLESKELNWRHEMKHVAHVYNMQCEVLQMLYNGEGDAFMARRPWAPYGSRYPDAVYPDNLVQLPGHLLKPDKVGDDDYPAQMTMDGSYTLPTFF